MRDAIPQLSLIREQLTVSVRERHAMVDRLPHIGSL
jgi:hypothetical protein